MRPLLTFVALGGALVLLASIAIGLMISIASGRPSWLLVGVFAIDSLALLLLAARMTRWRNKSHAGRDGETPA